jgi:hypothetical protein
MEIIDIANKIIEKIKLLELMRKEIKERAVNKARLNAEYDKQMALVIIQLKNGKIFKIFELDGEHIDGVKLPANLLEKIAKGLCWEARLKADEAEALYKSVISNIDSVQAELNGMQSINRHLDRS